MPEITGKDEAMAIDALVSIIIPNYNHEPYLKQRIESVLDQSYQNFEVIILDDFSTDNSRKIIEHFSSHPKVSKVIYNQQNTGNTFKQWQKGINEAKGDYIWIAESDDYCHPDFLAKHLTFLESNQKITLSYCQSNIVDENGRFLHSAMDWVPKTNRNIWEKDFTMDGRAFREAYLIYSNVVPNASAVVFRRSMLHSNSLQTDWKYCGDWRFWWELLQEGEVNFISSPLNYFRRHENTVSRPDTLLFRNEKLRLHKYFFYSADNADFREKVIKNYYDIRFRGEKQNLAKLSYVGAKFIGIAPVFIFKMFMKKLQSVFKSSL